jgi:acetylglutamate kinase
VRFVVKLGGAALEDKKILHAAGKAIADLVADGNRSPSFTAEACS